MLKLNIMPEKYKRNLKNQQILGLVRILLCLILFLIITNTIILLIAKIILQVDFIKTIEQADFQNKNRENYKKTVDEINKQMAAIVKIQQESVLWSHFFIILSDLIPKNIKLSYLKIDKNSGTIQLQGYAPTREKLLELKENLDKAKIFEEINLPIKSLLEKTDINFDITSKIIVYEF